MRAAPRRRCRRPDGDGHDPGRQRRLLERQVPGVRDRWEGRPRAADQGTDGRYRHASEAARRGRRQADSDRPILCSRAGAGRSGRARGGGSLAAQDAESRADRRRASGGARRPALRSAGFGRPDRARRARTLCFAGAAAPAQQPRTDPLDSGPFARSASGSLLRHRLPPRSQRACRPLRDPGATLRRRRTPVRVPRPVV